MSIEKNVQTVKDFFAAIGRGDKEALLALAAEDIEWIIPGEDWPLAGTRHGHRPSPVPFRRSPGAVPQGAILTWQSRQMAA